MRAVGRVSRRAGGRAVLALVLLSGCSAAPEARPQPAPPMRTAAPVGEPTSVTATASAPVAPDAMLSEIRSAPPACGLPVHALTGYRGRVGGVETVLQVNDGYGLTSPPVAPVEVDLTGDGGLDLVGVLSCTRDGSALPDHVVLYTGPATPVAAVDLASVQKQRLAIVRSLRVVGGDVRIEWTGLDRPDGPVTQYVGTVTPRGDGIAVTGTRVAGGPRSVAVDSASFMTADGNVHCTLQGDLAWCDVAQSTWRPPPSPGPTPTPGAQPTPSSGTSGGPTTTAPAGPLATASPTRTEGCGDRPYGRTFLLAGGRAKRACAGEQGPETAALGQPLTAWHRQGWDATVMVDGRRSAALTPGSTIATSAVRCRASADVVTCTDVRTQATFSSGRTVAKVSSG